MINPNVYILENLEDWLDKQLIKKNLELNQKIRPMDNAFEKLGQRQSYFYIIICVGIGLNRGTNERTHNASIPYIILVFLFRRV